MDIPSGGTTTATTTSTTNATAGDTKVSTIKRQRTQLGSRIETQHKTQLSLISSLQSIAFPHIVNALDLSLNLLSSFSPNNKPFVPTPSLPPALEITKIPLEPTHHSTPHDASLLASDSASLMGFERIQKVDLRNESGVAGVGGGGGGGSPLLVVRAMVAESLLQRVPFHPIDSSTVLRKLENDQNATEADRAALRELGGGEEAGVILAVEMALRAIAEENRGGVELEEFVVGGKSTVMVLNIDRSKLIKELPESSQLFDSSSEFNDNKGGISSSYGSGFGMGGGMGPKAMLPGEMWMGGIVGPRGMMMGPRGMMPRPPLNSMASPMVPYPQKMRTEEDEMNDLEALLNKKSFLEMQKSKTGEELLDLIHRPTAKETAVAAKFKTKGGSQLKEYCTALTKEDCRRQSGSFIACDKVHFRRIIAPHTDISQGDCSFLDTCRHMKVCIAAIAIITRPIIQNNAITGFLSVQS